MPQKIGQDHNCQNKTTICFVWFWSRCAQGRRGSQYKYAVVPTKWGSCTLRQTGTSWLSLPENWFASLILVGLSYKIRGPALHSRCNWSFYFHQKPGVELWPEVQAGAWMCALPVIDMVNVLAKCYKHAFVCLIGIGKSSCQLRNLNIVQLSSKGPVTPLYHILKFANSHCPWSSGLMGWRWKALPQCLGCSHRGR